MQRIFFITLGLLFSLTACQPDTVEAPDQSAPLSVSGSFTKVPSTSSGISFTNHVEENFTNFFARFQYVYNGGGVAIGDVDGDGLSDIFFTANEGENQLYRNLGDLKFADITEQAGIQQPQGWDNGTVMADVNGDGHLDIYICRGGSVDNSPAAERSNLLYLNDGSGKFREAAEELGLADEGYSLQAVFFDMDNDNDLDAYITNRPATFFIPHPEVLAAKERQDAAYSDQLYRNDGGKFTRVTEAAGITQNFGYGLGLVTADVNNDGFTDILVSNDYLENDYLYENQGDGTFKERIEQYTNHTSFYGMGIDAADLNNDGLEDLLQLDMSPEDYVRSKTTMASMNVDLYREIMESGFHDQYMHNSLQLNRGNGFFSEISQLAGIAKSDWSWAVLGADFDNDAQKEIFITNGYRRDVADKDGNIRFQEYLRSEERRQRSDEENARYVIDMFNSVPLQNYLYDDSGELTYTSAATAWGLTEKSFSNGAAYGDLDNDGDLDLVINNLEEEAFVYENTSTTNDYLRIELEGPTGNQHGIGAKITLAQESGQQFQQVKTVRGYLSSVEPVAHFGLGDLGPVATVEVTWPDGKVSTISNPAPNQLLKVTYTEAKALARQAPIAAPLLRETTGNRFTNAIIHQENEFDDYASQVLLPHGHSKEGPALAVGDVNGDGLEDFYLGGAKRMAGTLYLQNANGKFSATSSSFAEEDKGSEDTAARFFDADGDGDQDLYVVSGGSEFPEASKKFQDRLYLNDGQGNFAKAALPEIRSSGSCVVPHDMDGDGDLDLFVGGRVVPTRYPTAPQSYLLRNDGGTFTDITNLAAPALSQVGMVTAAQWTDLDADGTAELIIVGEWMPITIFQQQGKTYENVTADYQLEATQGWWNTVTAHDLDQDGDQDFILGNLGKNYKFQASAEKPFYVFASDFDQNGSNDIFLAKENGKDLVPIRGRECSSQQIPEIASKFPTYNAFAAAELEEIIDLEKPDAVKYEAQEFASSWLENKDGQFVLHQLPVATQFS
ncbi:MAG: VCBS repeat-containing protein, partial [Bacteroidota bacterium]